MPYTIALDLCAIDFNFPNGIKTYALNYLNTLNRVDHLNNYYIFTHVPLDIKYAPNFKEIQIDRTFPIISRELKIFQYCRKYSISTVHSLSQFAFFIYKPKRLISTVHDFSSMSHNSKRVAQLSNILKFRQTLQNADMIITDTYTVEKEIRKKISKNLKTIYPGINKLFFLSKPNYEKEKIVLCFADSYGRKNISTSLEAFITFNKTERRTFKLLIFAHDVELIDKLTRHIKKIDEASNIFIKKNTTDMELKYYYQNAFCLLYPSIYEGFGFPVLEAMSAGCLVILTKIPIFQEIAKNHALYANPQDPNKFAFQLMRINEDKKRYRKLINNGIKYAAKFNWAIYCKKMITIYKRTT